MFPGRCLCVVRRRLHRFRLACLCLQAKRTSRERKCSFGLVKQGSFLLRKSLADSYLLGCDHSAGKMKELGSHKATRVLNPEDQKLHFHRRENLVSVCSVCVNSLLYFFVVTLCYHSVCILLNTFLLRSFK